MGEASDDDVVAREHVHDIVSGRLPAEDVASNIAEDLRRIRSQLAAVTKRLWTAVEALDDITRCNSNEFCEEPDVIARQALAAIRAPEEKK
jgi:hypothetical protein